MISFMLRATLVLAMTTAYTATADDAPATDASLIPGATGGYAENNGVKLHYVSVGSGPLVVFIHGFPDFWYSWRHQMKALSANFQCVAYDQRGFNLSDKPAGVENYDIALLISDVEAVIKAQGKDKAFVVGHDWGGFVAWWLAAFRPDLVEKLVVCNLPHPKGLSRELVNNPEQQRMSEYAQAFRQPGAAAVVDKDLVATMGCEKELEAYPAYKAAMANSDMEAMLSYYKQNYPAAPYTEDTREVPLISMPVLVFHGLKDPALHHYALNKTWDWVDAPLTIVTLPKAAHWVQHDAAEYVNATLADWLARK